jgi:hypothetical protein
MPQFNKKGNRVIRIVLATMVLVIVGVIILIASLWGDEQKYSVEIDISDWKTTCPPEHYSSKNDSCVAVNPRNCAEVWFVSKGTKKASRKDHFILNSQLSYYRRSACFQTAEWKNDEIILDFLGNHYVFKGGFE